MRRDKEFYKEHFANFGVDQLEELIQRDWQADGTLLNAEQVLAIAEILEEKIPSGVTDEEIEADWQSFLNDYLPLLEVDEPLTEAKGNGAVYIREVIRNEASKIKQYYSSSNVTRASRCATDGGSKYGAFESL